MPKSGRSWAKCMELVRAKDVWIDDRNFCTTSFLFGIARHEAFFVVRQHASYAAWGIHGQEAGMWAD